MLILILAAALLGQLSPYDNPRSPVYEPPEVQAARIQAGAIRQASGVQQSPPAAMVPIGQGLTLGIPSGDWPVFLVVAAAFIVSSVCYGLFLLRKIAYRP